MSILLPPLSAGRDYFLCDSGLRGDLSLSSLSPLFSEVLNIYYVRIWCLAWRYTAEICYGCNKPNFNVNGNNYRKGGL
jgi:hypothetical protein